MLSTANLAASKSRGTKPNFCRTAVERCTLSAFSGSCILFVISCLISSRLVILRSTVPWVRNPVNLPSNAITSSTEASSRSISACVIWNSTVIDEGWSSCFDELGSSAPPWTVICGRAGSKQNRIANNTPMARMRVVTVNLRFERVLAASPWPRRGEVRRL